MNFCPNCGYEMKDAIVDDTSVKMCPNCHLVDWDNWVYVSCVTIAYTPDDKIVLVKLKGKEAGKLTFPGGFRNLGETLEEGAKREFCEETGMQVHDLSLYRIYTKDVQRLVWVIFKGKVDHVSFRENSEVSEIILVDKDSVIDPDLFRGQLTLQLFQDVIGK